MDLITIYTRRRQIVTGAIKRVKIKCKQCNGMGMTIEGNDYFTWFSQQLEHSLGLRGIGRGRASSYGFFDEVTPDTPPERCSKCDGKGHHEPDESELTAEQKEHLIQLYSKNKQRKDRQEKASKTNKPWDRKQTRNDPRFG